MIVTSTSIIKKLLLLFLVFAGLHYSREFLMPLAIGAVLATLFLPFCKWMEVKKISRGLATTICLLVLLLAIGGVVTLIGWQISELANDVGTLKHKGGETLERIHQYVFSHFGISREEQAQLIKDQQSSVTGFLQSMAGSITDIFTSFIFMLVYIFLLLYYRIHIKQFILKLSPAGQQLEMEQILQSTTHVSQQYLLGLTKMIMCLWVMYGIGFSLLGVENAIFFAVLCGLLEIIPFIGNLTGTIITILVAAVHGAGLPILGGIAVTYGVVQLIQGWVLEPLIVGPQVKINPMFTIFALVLGEIVWGIPGIILAIPLTAMLKIICDHIEPLKPYGFLIGEIETKKTESDFLKKIKIWIKK